MRVNKNLKISKVNERRILSYFRNFTEGANIAIYYFLESYEIVREKIATEFTKDQIFQIMTVVYDQYDSKEIIYNRLEKKGTENVEEIRDKLNTIQGIEFKMLKIVILNEVERGEFDF